MNEKIYRQMRHLLLLFLSCFLLTPWLYAQTLTSLRAESLTDSVRVYYALVDSTPGRTYQVDLYAIRDKDTLALQKVRGGVGDSVAPGEHSITWYAYEEWDRYRGPLSFEVKALPNFSFLNAEDTASVRRARGIEFNWYGQNSTLDSLRVDLYRYDEFLENIARVNEKESYAWRVPPKLPLGEGYRIKLVGAQSKIDYGYGPYFTVDRRYPLWAQIAVPTSALAAWLVIRGLRRLPPPEETNQIR